MQGPQQWTKNLVYQYLYEMRKVSGKLNYLNINLYLPWVPEVIFFARSRVSEEQSPEKKKKPSVTRTQNLISVQLVVSDVPPNWFSPAAWHSICLFSFLTFRLSMFARGAAIREIARAKWQSHSPRENYLPVSRRLLLDLQLEFTDIWIRQTEFI